MTHRFRHATIMPWSLTHEGKSAVEKIEHKDARPNSAVPEARPTPINQCHQADRKARISPRSDGAGDSRQDRDMPGPGSPSSFFVAPDSLARADSADLPYETEPPQAGYNGLRRRGILQGWNGAG